MNDQVRTVSHGVLLPNGCHVVHGTAAAIKQPFAELPVIMHELHPGGGVPFAGQFGFIPFRQEFRLPRHIHVGTDGVTLLPERILVVGGVALVELNGEIMIIAPGTLIDIPPGVPHTWTACPPGIALPDDTCSDGSFLMIYDYAAPTNFFPTASTASVATIAGYQPHTGDIEAIRFPRLDRHQVTTRAGLVWNREIRSAATR
jgi:hypothetical protein